MHSIYEDIVSHFSISRKVKGIVQSTDNGSNVVAAFSFLIGFEKYGIDGTELTKKMSPLMNKKKKITQFC